MPPPAAAVPTRSVYLNSSHLQRSSLCLCLSSGAEDCNLHCPSRTRSSHPIACVFARAGRRVRVPAAAAVQYAHAERRLRARRGARRRRREAARARLAGAARTRGPRRRLRLGLAAALRVAHSVSVRVRVRVRAHAFFKAIYSYCLFIVSTRSPSNHVVARTASGFRLFWLRQRANLCCRRPTR